MYNLLRIVSSSTCRRIHASHFSQFSTRSLICKTNVGFSLNLEPSTSQIGYRYVRTRAGENRNQQEKEHSQSEEEKPFEESSEKENSQNKPKLDPATVRKLRMYVLAVAGLSFVTSFLALTFAFKEGSGVPPGVSPEHFTKQGIDFRTFVERFLKTGEVRNIVFCPAQQRAIAFLHDGAVIEGKPVADKAIVVAYSQNGQQFWADIRKEEAVLGIALSNGVKIEMYQGLTTVKVVELMIGLLILAFLGTQYGRLIRKRMLANQAGKGGSAPKQP